MDELIEFGMKVIAHNLEQMPPTHETMIIAGALAIASAGNPMLIEEAIQALTPIVLKAKLDLIRQEAAKNN